jgi:hypothetical protein
MLQTPKLNSKNRKTKKKFGRIDSLYLVKQNFRYTAACIHAVCVKLIKINCFLKTLQNGMETDKKTIVDIEYMLQL